MFKENIATDYKQLGKFRVNFSRCAHLFKALNKLNVLLLTTANNSLQKNTQTGDEDFSY